MSDAIARLNAALSGGYRIERELGEGGMATVYLADDLRHERKVALKVLKPQLAAVVGAERFLAEIKTTANLQHPAILPLFDSGDADSFLFYVMPYVDGETLRARIDREQQLPVDVAVGIATGMADALDYAHRRGVIHRDIKPANVMLQDDRPVIMDFGVALATSRTNGDRLTETGLSVGTPFYMSPEQAAGEETIDGRSDQYSLACVLYEMLVGEPPFTGPTSQAIIAKRFVQAPADVAALRNGVPAGVGRAVTKALNRMPIDRFGSVAELARALEAAHEPFVPATPPAPAKSIAVLPFANLGSDQESEYFSDGITEDIITHVSKVPDLKVISRTSVMRLKGSDKSLREIGRELGVGSILEGSVRRFGERVRIVAQLIDAERDSHLWAETYDRELIDVFEIQSDVARKIAAALQAELTPSDRVSLKKRPTQDIEAYQRYLKGRFFWARRNEEGLRRAIDFFEQALESDPTYALAFAGIADCYNLLPWYGSLAPSEAFPKAKAAAKRALALDQELAEAHKSLAFTTMLYDWDWEAADREFQRALTLAPGDAPTHHWYFEYLAAVGRFDDALEAIERAYDLDPLSLINNSALGWCHYFRREYAKAIDQLHRALEMDSDFIWARFILSKARLMTESYDAVIRDAKTSSLVAGGHPLMLATLGVAYARSGQHVEALRVAERLIEPGDRRYTSKYFPALIHLGIGEPDRAIQLLEAAFEERDFWLVFVRSDPLWDPLRENPAFRELIDRVGLADSQ